MGMKQLSGDDALFYMVENNTLIGLCALHVDDFLTGGTKKFEDILDKKLQGRFTFGKIELQKFKFTGMNIEQTAEGIFIDQIDNINSILPITMNRVGPKDEKLTDKEFKAYRALTGQLSWAAENSRPDFEL